MLEKDYLNGLGGLFKLSPLSRLAKSLHEPDFYRIINGGEATLDYMKRLLTDPERIRHHWQGVYKFAKGSLEEITEALSEPDEYKPFDVKSQIRETVQNYHSPRLSDEEVDFPELRSRFQRYKLILENCYNGIKLTKQEESDKKDFIKMLDFFIYLEQNHQSYEIHMDSLDDE